MELSEASDAPGRRLVQALTDIGIDAVTTGRDRTTSKAESLDAAIIGADAVSGNSVLNGVPSLGLARAVDGHLPLYVVCESVKFVPQAQLAPGYDRVPMDLVCRAITEAGSMTAAKASERASSRRCSE